LSYAVTKFFYNLCVNPDEPFYVLKQQVLNRFQSTCVYLLIEWHDVFMILYSLCIGLFAFSAFSFFLLYVVLSLVTNKRIHYRPVASWYQVKDNTILYFTLSGI